LGAIAQFRIDMETKESFTELLKHYGPFAYLVFIFWGLLSEFVYFNQFNIVITYYVDISEILLLQYDDVLFLMLYIVLGLIGFGLVYWSVSFFTGIVNLFKKENKFKTSYYIVTGVTVVLYFAYSYYHLTKSDILEVAGVGIGLTLLIAFSSKTMETWDKIFRSLTFITIFFFAYPLSKREKILNEQQNIRIETNSGEILKIKDGLRLIGETKNYIFIYDKVDSSTTVINRDKVKLIKYD
jgi:hypothetical protein